MADCCTTTPFGASEPLFITTRPSLARQLETALDTLERVIDLEPLIAASSWESSSALLRRQELYWEASEAALRRVASRAVEGDGRDLSLGALAFLMHRTLASETGEDVCRFSGLLAEAVDDWIAGGIAERALFERARDLTSRFAAVFADVAPALSADDLSPVL